MEFDLDIPYNWQLRQYQAPLWDALVNKDIKKAVYVWHRRAGKDLFGLNFLIKCAILGQVGTYWHIFPSYKQGKRAIWDETTLDGRKYIDFIPPPFIESKNDQEMKIKFINGSIYQIVGSDNPDSLRGSGIKGALFSEYAEQNPIARDTIQPMIMASNGFELFNFTPKGQNHSYELYEMAKNNPKWFSQILTVDDTQIFSKEQLEDIKEETLSRGKTLDFFYQEYYCSFDNAIEGSYYAKQIKRAEEDGRISNIPYESSIPVETFWDLGVNDTTAIWFVQAVGKEIRVIDYYENNGEGLPHYANIINQKGYTYSRHNAPHDIKVRELGSGVSRLETAYKLGIRFDVVPNISIEDGINASRSIFSKCYFDKTKCKQGLLALKNYKKEFDQNKNCFKSKPLHNWASNGADSFRYFAVGFRERLESTSYQPQYAIM